MLLAIAENGIHMVVDKTVNGTLLLLHLSPKPFNPQALPKEGDQARDRFTMVEVHRSGENQNGVFGSKHICSNPGGPLGVPVYESHSSKRNESGLLLSFVQTAGDLRISSLFQFYDGIPVIRSWTELENIGTSTIPVEYVSSFALTGLAKDEATPWEESAKLHLQFSGWKEELQWRSFTLPELGISRFHADKTSSQRVAINNTGTYAAKEFMPAGCLEIGGTVYSWQIESHGSWAWELSEVMNQLYLQLSGPTERECQWFKTLLPGERFQATQTAIAIQSGKAEDSFKSLNQYRRRIRRPNEDNKTLPVIFNDYMNCLMAEPTTEKILPLAERAASLGAEYYVIDAGWYADGHWWDSIGEWKPSAKRFPDGLPDLIAKIAAMGLKPGLWLELERMGMKCPLVEQWPEECFFRRHGRRVVTNSSLHLDFRHPVVREHSDKVIDHLVGDWGVKFLKIDFNFEIGPGTEVSSDSFGDGLLQHQRAYLSWLDAVLTRHPGLVIENCASGGMRNTYSMLSRLSICSTTDNENYLRNARISVNCASSYCMEQAGVWAYPLASASDEEVVMNMVSALSWRPYLSGQIMGLSEEKLELIREGVGLYKRKLRKLIPSAAPLWPLGLTGWNDPWAAFALKDAKTLTLSVWRFEGGDESMDIPLKKMKVKSAALLYPSKAAPCHEWKQGMDSLKVSLPPNTARIFSLELE